MLKNQIKEDLKIAMKTGDEIAKNTLRSILSEFTNFLVANGKTPQDEISNEEGISVIKRLKKQREDSIQKYLDGGREDLAEQEKKEKEILEKYLPEMMSQDKIKEIAEKLKDELKIEDKSKMGILIGKVMQETKGEADGKDVKKVVESLFN